MRLFAADGRRLATLAQFRQLRDVLRRDLDAEPDEATRRLHDAIAATAGTARPHGRLGRPGRDEAAHRVTDRRGARVRTGGQTASRRSAPGLDPPTSARRYTCPGADETSGAARRVRRWI